jgi:hypothetical protein
MKTFFTKSATLIILFVLSLYSPCSSQESLLAPGQSSPSTYTKPRVSIITSIFDPKDMFIEQFLIDITRQTIFNECELLLIEVPASPNTRSIIEPYLAAYPNIRYIKLDSDPGLYGVWNLGAQLAQADFLTNANIDDRRNPYCLEMHAKALEENPHIGLVYSDFYCTRFPNTTFEHPQACTLANIQEFSPKTMYMCLAGPMPMWRKMLHEECGYFRNDLSSSADWEFWCRMASMGIIFKKIPGISGVYYINPQGASTDQTRKKTLERDAANNKIAQMYLSMWQK